MITNHNIPHNMLDILQIDKKIKKPNIIKVGVPANDNITKTLGKKTRKYQELWKKSSQLRQLMGNNSIANNSIHQWFDS